jgi:hypothetical protein
MRRAPATGVGIGVGDGVGIGDDVGRGVGDGLADPEGAALKSGEPDGIGAAQAASAAAGRPSEMRNMPRRVKGVRSGWAMGRLSADVRPSN